MNRRIPVLAVVATAVGVLVPTRAAAPDPCPGPKVTPNQVFSGTFTTAQEGAYVLVPFDVPSEMTRVRVRLCYDQPSSPTSSQLRHTIDLGVYEATKDGFHDADEFRGWGGSSRPDVLINPRGSNEGGADTTTVGYKPGRIPAGRWAAELGVASVAGRTEGDSDESVDWRLEVSWANVPADTEDRWRPARYDARPARRGPGWYAGDMHVHARHSNPNDASMREVFDYAFTPLAQGGAGLDFITLSDYVTDRHWDEIGRFQNDYPGKLITRSAEVITYRGHFNNHVSGRFVDYRTGPIYERQDDGSLKLIRGPVAPKTLFDQIRRAGGFTQINHPTIFPSAVPGFSSMCRGCPWDYSDPETGWQLVDAFEVQTGPAGLSQPSGNEPGPNPFTLTAIEWWDRLRRAGHRITAVGASDSHKAGRTPDPVTHSPIGEATTVVFAPELSEKGLKEAVRAGHAYVKFFGNHGPDLRLNARPAGAAEFGHMMGDVLRAPSAEFRAQVLRGGPSPQPRELVVFRNGVPAMAVPVTSNDFAFTFTATEPGDYRLQLQRGTAIEALTNPITLVR